MFKKTAVFLFIYFSCAIAFAANYPLEITQPQPSLNTANRYYKAYTGLEYKVRVGVIGGVYPYEFSLTTYPSGMSIDADTGIITWTAASVVESGSPHAVTVSVTDQESTTVTRSWTITVNTSGAYFLDAVNGLTVANGGAGTLASPWKTLDDLLEAGTVSAGTIAYFKNGTYTTQGLTETAHGDYGYGIDLSSLKPLIWLAYPGQTPTIDFESSGYDDPEPYFGIDRADVYISGFNLTNCWNFCFKGFNNRPVFAWNNFSNLRRGRDGSNSAFVMHTGVAENGRYYSYYHNNSFANVFIDPGNPGGAFLKFYSDTKALFEFNTLTNENGSNTASQEGLSWKAYNTYSVTRKNQFNYVTRHAIEGSANRNGNNTHEFNLFRNCGNSLILNEFGTITTPYWFYRNTFSCPVEIRNVDGSAGPFTFTDNIFQNSASTYNGLTYYNVTDASNIVRDGDLYAASGIVDSAGLLQGSYRTTYLDTKGWETTYADTAAPTVDNATVNGSTVTINFNESVVSTNYVSGDFNLDCTNPTASNVALSSPSGSGSSRTFSLASPIVYGQSCNLDYLGRTNGIEDAAGNDLAAREDITISNTTPDTTAPTVSGALPTGEQECSSDPRNVTASVTTSENATCRYGWTSVPFGSMANFSTTGGTSHSTILSGLSCGSSYTLYVLCADSSANISSPVTTINWSIASQYAPRGITGTGIIKMGSIH